MKMIQLMQRRRPVLKIVSKEYLLEKDPAATEEAASFGGKREV